MTVFPPGEPPPAKVPPTAVQSETDGHEMPFRVYEPAGIGRTDHEPVDSEITTGTELLLAALPTALQ